MKVLTFGEILLRLASPGYTRFFQKDCLETSFCGAEANVAVSLAILGVDSAFLKMCIGARRYMSLNRNPVKQAKMKASLTSGR